MSTVCARRFPFASVSTRLESHLQKRPKTEFTFVLRRSTIFVQLAHGGCPHGAVLRDRERSDAQIPLEVVIKISFGMISGKYRGLGDYGEREGNKSTLREDCKISRISPIHDDHFHSLT